MALTSITFFRFVCVVLVLAFALGRRNRGAVLFAASWVFYATWNSPAILVALGVVTLSSYLCAIHVERQDNPERKNRLAWAGIGINLGVLLVFRYRALLVGNVNSVAGIVGLPSAFLTGNFVTSIGVSYYVLQAISYLLDVRDEAIVAERGLWRYALFVAFFPKLLQGPIERAENLLTQLNDLPPFKISNITVGTRLVLWGLFQKVVVADRLAPFVNAVYGDVRHYQGMPLLVATYLFAAQLYFDFAGYTDMALGVARLFGIRLTQNFNLPYLSASVPEFWRRWHISFSSWLQDYVFRPLQLELRHWRTWGTPVALLGTFLVSGLWHGTTWCFVIWGLLHGIYLGTSTLGRSWQEKIYRNLGLTASSLLRPLQVVITFHLICFAWIFFRASSVGDAFYVVRHLASGLPATLAQLTKGQGFESLVCLKRGVSEFGFALALIGSAAAIRTYLRGSETPTDGAMDEVRSNWRQSSWLGTIIYASMLYLVVFVGSATQGFVYQQF